MAKPTGQEGQTFLNSEDFITQNRSKNFEHKEEL